MTGQCDACPVRGYPDCLLRRRGQCDEAGREAELLGRVGPGAETPYRRRAMERAGVATDDIAVEPEPALPSRRRMAGELAKTGLAMIGRAARGKSQAATPEEQARRWEACRACTEHFRPSDRRCGAVDGCGCWLDEAIPLAAKSCPLTPPRWGPE